MSRLVNAVGTADVRIGVTELEHRLLDLAEDYRCEDVGFSGSPWPAHLDMATGLIKRAARATSEGTAAALAIQAAAHLLRHVEQTEDRLVRLSGGAS